MSLQERLDNLAKTKLLSPHQPEADELNWHIQTAQAYLRDAINQSNSHETRFSVGYNAAHQLLQAALKMRGYRTTSEKGHRAVLFQLLDDLIPGAAGSKNVLARANNLRHKSEYDGDPIDITDGLLSDLISAVENVMEEVQFYAKKQTTPVSPSNSRTKNR